MNQRAPRTGVIELNAVARVPFPVSGATLSVAWTPLAVRASGAEVGWGYQLQSPAVVAALAALMFVIGLILAGVFEVGASLTRLGGLGGSGEGSAFLTGVLATVV